MTTFLKDKSYLYNYEEIVGRPALDLLPQQPFFSFPSNVPIQDLPPLGQFRFVNPICATGNPQVIEYNLIKDYLSDAMEPSIVINTNTSDFYYPFDKRVLYLSIWVQTEDDIVIPDVVGEVHSPDWDVYLPINTTTNSDIFPPYSTIKIDYLRPIFVRYLIVVLLILLFSLIVASIFIKENSNYVGVLLGALLGLNGLRPILKPIEIEGNTMIDLLFMSFYIFLGISSFAHYVILPFWKFTNQVKISNPKKTSGSRKK